ncbi:hypothetical protein C8F04DRAFT_1134752 [Mycena alexandri]|uniref:Uncharacterized protein n=1 Tax=Mycena alexandri TaxID=1745969 RepID=A0AAD6S9J8_9AGAR|nr:hypothetical protein C8F04DRAFT_1134752 [Mycena alexandri]
MFRKFSKSSSSLNTPATASGPPSSWSTKQRLQTALKTASESNLPGIRKTRKETTHLGPKPCKNAVMAGEVRGRRATIATSGKPDTRPAVRTPKLLFQIPSSKVEIGQKIVPYMPELYEEVDPIRLNGRFYTWEDPSWLDYVPLPLPPRKNVKCGRVGSKPKYGPGVCSTCSSKRGFSCQSSRYLPGETRSRLAFPAEPGL